jgi:hypothetical protein
MGRKISRFWIRQRAKLLYRNLYNEDADAPTPVRLYTLLYMVALTQVGRAHSISLLVGCGASAVAGVSRGSALSTLASTSHVTT